MKNKLILFVLLPFIIWAQETITISGDVKDFETGESLIGATIFIPELKLGTSTNTYGWFSITIPKGEYNAEISYIGYLSEQIFIKYNTDNNRSITENILNNIIALIQSEKDKNPSIKEDQNKVKLYIKKIENIDDSIKIINKINT